MLRKGFLLVCFLGTLCSKALFAAPGDTTWVTLFDNVELNHYGNYPISATLPDGTTKYQKIRMHYILGRRACPGEQYCGSWDYTTKVYVLPDANTNLELMRVITPYATDWNVNRKHTYTTDVTDYYPVLKNTQDFRFVYEGYSWGFTVSVKLEFIEGNPPRDVLDISPLYDGYFTYGHPTQSIETQLIAKDFNVQPGVVSANVINTISGHGMDPLQNCAEFCSKYYDLKVNNSAVERIQVWKDDCGHNALAAQTGTWVFDRAGWCPGEQVYPINHTIATTQLSSQTIKLDMDFQPYNANTTNNLGGYAISSHLFQYGAYNYSKDLAIEKIIAPSNDENEVNRNAICGRPIVLLKNNGQTAITSAKLKYHLQGSSSPFFATWNGNLAFNQLVEFELDQSARAFLGNESNVFIVEIVEVNGTPGDDNSHNNRLTSKFTHVEEWFNGMRIDFRTNKATDANTGFNETTWKIVDPEGNVVKERKNLANDTRYIDTLNLPQGCYTFIVSDSGCDGISWWYYPNYPVNPGNGTLRLMKHTNGTLKNINGDFGCEMRIGFTVGQLLSVNNLSGELEKAILQPNPAKEMIQVLFAKPTQGLLTVSDVSGRLVKSMLVDGDHQTIGLEDLQNGVYLISVNGSFVGRFVKQ